jgi:acetylornithine/succinyldiaminopimelate/putrescine aminotransferase
MGELFKKKLKEVQEKYPEKITDVRGAGLLIGVEIKPELAAQVFKKLHEKKMLTSLCKGLTIRVAPALNITEKEIDIFIKALNETMEEI